MHGNLNKLWKFIYFLPVLPVYLIIYTVISTFTQFYFYDENEFDSTKITASILFYLFASMTIVCHTIAMMTNPGNVNLKKIIPRPVKEEIKNVENDTEIGKENITADVEENIVTPGENKENNKKSQISEENLEKNLKECENHSKKEPAACCSCVCCCYKTRKLNINGEKTKDTCSDGCDKKTLKSDPFYCKKCVKARPERCHHCSICQKCVLKLDHHCPWIANCVGFYNQKAFYLFLFYASFGNLIACICLGMKLLDPSFALLILRPKRRMNPDAENIVLEILYSMKEPLLMIIGACLAFAMTIAIGGLFFYQTYLISNNLTSIESMGYKKKQDSPFFCGHKILMYRSVLGFGSFLFWFVPIFEPNKYNNGHSFLIPKRVEPNVEIKIKNN